MAIFKHPHGGFTEHGGEHDQVMDHGEVRRRKKKASKKFRDAWSHLKRSRN